MSTDLLLIPNDLIEIIYLVCYNYPKSKEALDAHLDAKHMKEIVPLLRDLREGAGEMNIYQKVE